MGMERKSNEEGIQVEDIISAIKGHVPDMYEFNPKESLNMKHKTYKDSPRRADQMHCVVCVVEADKITLMDKSLVNKFETIRSQVNKMKAEQPPPPPPPKPLLEKPWRNLELNEQVKNELLQDIRNYETLTESVEEPRILLIGQIGAGKSSFFNSVKSIFRGHVTLQAGSGQGETSVSNLYRIYPVHDGKGGKRLPYILCDTMGLEREQNEDGIHMNDIISVINGHVPDLYEFDPKASITKNDIRYRHEPVLGDKVHCVVFVIDADKMSLINKILRQKFQSIRTTVHKMGIPVLVLITKVDEACLEVKKDLSKVYWSRYLNEKVTKLGQELGVPMSAISLVRNYSSETDLDWNFDILILNALKQMLRAADDCLDDMKLRGLTRSSST
ncbi:interferon-induced protein 44-like [Erpetoichthys calabaricus]|uniref:interferon-induced protein 44-like n=1 Tax=Erpetoichthys calabaricus TaxID=27687 RepID=UPI0022349A97|nr:interferon-induced protein 44-like [Erpetoichthys calabaricus]